MASLVGFPGGPVVKNPPTNAGDTGSILGLGSFCMLRNNEAPAAQLLSQHSQVGERSHCSEQPGLHDKEWPQAPHLEKAQAQQQKPIAAKK